MYAVHSCVPGEQQPVRLVKAADIDITAGLPGQPAPPWEKHLPRVVQFRPCPIGLGDSSSRCTAQVAGGCRHRQRRPPRVRPACWCRGCPAVLPVPLPSLHCRPLVHVRGRPGCEPAPAYRPVPCLSAAGLASHPGPRESRALGAQAQITPNLPGHRRPPTSRSRGSAGLWRACCASRQRRPPYPRAPHRASTLSNSRCRLADRRSTRWRPH